MEDFLCSQELANGPERVMTFGLANKFYIELMKNNVVFDYSNISAVYLKKTYGINVKSFHFFDFPEYQEEEEPERTIDIFLSFLWLNSISCKSNFGCF